MIGDKKIYDKLSELSINFEYFEHPAAPTIEIASKYWKNINDTTHCKNIFLRNHKGNKHYLVVIESTQTLDISALEKKLKQGKLSFASEQRMKKYLNVTAGSVSPLGLVNDNEKHVFIFFDNKISVNNKISFHPNDNRVSLVLAFDDFLKFIYTLGNEYKFIDIS